MALPFPIPSTKPKGDTKGDEKGIPETGKKGLSLSVCIVKVLRSEPDRAFVVRDLVDRTGGKYPSVKRVLSRLSVTGKGSGPVRRVRHGMYQYAPEKEQDSLRALARSGNWKIENLTFVSLGAHPIPVSLSKTGPEPAKGTPSDSSQTTPHPNVPYPMKLETGQLVTWEDYQNGTQVIRISANGAPPISPDHAITLIGSLKKFGMDDSWKCVSLELNVDSYRHRIDASYSLQTIEGLFLKAYQHGYNTRLEIADRRDVPIREVLELFHAIAGGMEGKATIRTVKAFETRLQKAEKDARLGLTIASGEREKRIEAQHGTKRAKVPPPSLFKTGTEIRQEQVPAIASGSAK
jgi:hypothetical protein